VHRVGLFGWSIFFHTDLDYETHFSPYTPILKTN
jgi:hypothetical protein